MKYTAPKVFHRGPDKWFGIEAHEHWIDRLDAIDDELASLQRMTRDSVAVERVSSAREHLVDVRRTLKAKRGKVKAYRP